MQFDLGTLLGILGIGGYVIAGIFAFRGMWSKESKEKESEADALSDKLIQRLQQTVDQQEKTISNLTGRIDQTTKELHQMQGRNQVLESLFGGNENSIMAFVKKTPELFQIADENNTLAKQNAEALAQLTTTMAQFVNSLQPLLIHLELKKPLPPGVE